MAEATIRDVARRAQLSVATVSRALNGFENVSELARERITAAVTELGYVPHAGARSLSLSRNNAIGVVLPDLHGEFFSEIVRGMDREASRRGYLLLLSNLHAGGAQAANALRAMRGRVDGLIVMAPHLGVDELSAALPRGLPSILINTRDGSGQFPAIHLDNAAGVRAVVDHLAALGRKRLVHIAGPSENIDAQEREVAFLAAVAAQRLHGRVVAGDFEMESGEAAIRQLMTEGARFDAVFAANDNMAIGALETLRAAGVRVPEDVAIVGFDDIPLARHIGITTVRVRIAELGERALQRLVDGLIEDGGGDELHAPELVIRATTDPKANG
ncbi:MAG: LacI family DNA-binding transcriptional regulator [Pseudomonadota bacterium]